MTPVVRRWTLPTAGLSGRVLGYFVTGEEACLISQVRDKREGGNWGGIKWRKFSSYLPTKRKSIQSILICLSFLRHFPFSLLPALEEVALSPLSACDPIMMESLETDIWLTDRQAWFLSKEREVVLAEDKMRESPLQGEVGTNDWAKEDKMEWSSIKRPGVISSFPPSPTPLNVLRDHGAFRKARCLRTSNRAD